MWKLLVAIVFSFSCAPVGDDRVLPAIDVDPRQPSATTVRSEGTMWGEAPFPGPAFDALPEGFPNANAAGPVFDDVRALTGSRAGFCTTCNVVIGFDGAIDESSLPGLEFVDLESGERVGADYEWHEEDQTLVVRPQRPYVLRPASRVAVELDGLRGDDGHLVAAPDGRVTTFETDDPARELRAIRGHIHAGPASVAVVDHVFAADRLDGLLGSVGQTAPGIDVADPADDETIAMRHATTSIVVLGRFDAARFLTGEGDEVGTATRDADGLPTVAGRHDVPFVLIVPRGADIANLPVVVMHHGFNASRVTALAIADTAGAAGFAVLGIDAYQHGDRAASASDRENAMRGVEGADGLAETSKLDVVSRVFGFTGVPSDRVLSPAWALSAFLQFSADAISTVRFARDGDLAALRAVGGLETLAFDRDRVVYLGNSMGAVVGTGVIAAEPDLAGAVLNVMPGSIIETLAESGEFRPLTEQVFLPLLGVREEFDEVRRAMLFDPTVDLFRWVLEPVDPLALSRSRLVDNVLVQLAGHDEVAAPRPSRSVAAAGEYPLVSEYDGAMHGMLEVNVQESRFEAPLLPPLQKRARPLRVENPVRAVHDEITDFLMAVQAR